MAPAVDAVAPQTNAFADKGVVGSVEGRQTSLPNSAGPTADPLRATPLADPFPGPVAQGFGLTKDPKMNALGFGKDQRPAQIVRSGLRRRGRKGVGDKEEEKGSVTNGNHHDCVLSPAPLADPKKKAAGPTPAAQPRELRASCSPCLGRTLSD